MTTSESPVKAAKRARYREDALAAAEALFAEHGVDADLIFTPHLLPVARGILSTITVPLVRPLDDDLLSPWRSRYAGERFIEIEESLPELRHVAERNVVRIAVRGMDGLRTPTIQVFSAIDNLMKGAAGQALQNANLMLGLHESAGLPA